MPAPASSDPALELTGRQLLPDFGDTERAVTAADLDADLDERKLRRDTI